MRKGDKEKKVLGLILILMCVGTIFSGVVAATTYDPQAAVNYADTWWNGRNPNYHDYSSEGGDCATVQWNSVSNSNSNADKYLYDMGITTGQSVGYYEPYKTQLDSELHKIEAPNLPPTAIIDSITPDPAEQGTDTVSFYGHGTDPAGTVVAYNWSSSMDGQLSTSAAFTKPASELSVGTHTIYFKVQDNDGTWSTEDTADLTIYPANQQPTAIVDSITPDPAEQGTDTVSFSGHGTDPNGAVEAYNWSSSVDGQLSTSAAFTKPASELSVGTHTFYFKVQDDDGAWSTEDTEDLTINPANQQPTAIVDSITPDPAEQGTDTVSFSGHGTDPNGAVEAYNWSSSVDGPLSTSASFTKPASELSVGTHTIYFKVQDDDGAWSTEDTEDLTINPANQQPTAIVDSITPDPAEQGTDTVSFSGHGTDPNGAVEAYNWSSSVDGPLSTSASFTKPASELSVGTHTFYFKVQDDDGAWSTEDTADLTIYPGPELSYSPESHEFCDMREGETDNTTFEIWNSGTDTLTYSLSETCDWLEVHPTSGSSTGEHNTITVDMDTTGLSEGSHTCDITINSNDGSGTFTVMVNVMQCPCGNMSVNPTSWSTTLNCSESDKEIVTVSATGGTIKGVTVSKIFGPTWLSVSQTDLGDIASGSNKTFTMTAAPPSEASGDFTYTVTVSNTCGTPSTRDVSGTIHVSCPCGNKGVYPTRWSPTLNCGESDSQIVTVSASDCIVNGVTVSKVSGPTWLSVSQTDLGDIASGSSETFTVTAAPPAGTSSGDYPYTIRVSNTCGSPSSRDVTGTIKVNENAEGQTDYWAVIVGVADYTGTLYDLAYTDDDAIDLYNTLLLSDHWQADHIMLLLDSEADRAGILTAFDWLDSNEDPDDVVLFFFSGHGTYGPDDDGDELDGWDEFFCPYDFNNIRDDELDAELDRLGSTSIAVIMDTCFAGGMTKDSSVKTLPKQKVKLTDGFAKDIQSTGKDMGDAGRVVLMACDDDEYSYEIYALENGLFSYYVIEGLERYADAEGNGDNICSAEETFVYAEPRVVDIISTQHPQLYDEYSGELPITRLPCPELSYSPTSHDFLDKCVGETDSTTFELWNSGTDTLTYTLSESCGWVDVNPTSGSSTVEHDTITIDIDTTDLFEGYHTCDITISSNGGSGTFIVMVNVVSCSCGNMGVNPTSWSPTLNCGESDNEIVTVSASDGIVNGVTVSKVSGPTWLSVSQTDLGDIASGSSKTFTITASLSAGTRGDFAYTVRVSNTCGSPSTRDVSGTIHVDYPESSWTFMVYLDGDNNLEGAGIDDFMEMSSVGSTSDVNIVVQFDRIPGYDSSYGDWTTCKRFHITSGMPPTTLNAISDLGECNMGDPNTLRDFVEWSMTEFPADNYALILWNHGDGWKSINDWVPWADDIKDAKDAGVTRGICWDITNNDYLSLQETEVALTGKYVQLLGYDACLMHMIEVVYQVMANAGVSVGSEESEPGDGWPYDTILNDLTVTPTMTEDALATVIVDRYMASYPTYNDLTQSAMDNSALPNLVIAVDNLAQALINEINTGNWAQVQQARSETEEIYYNYYIDLYHFAEKIPLYVPGAAAQAQTVMNAVSGSVYEAHGSSVPNDHGLSIYFPRVEGDYLASYDNTAFASDTLWDEFLKRYYEGPELVCDGTATSCGIYPNCENCNEHDGCYAYGNGCEERDYYCVSNDEGCGYTTSNRHTDYYDDWDYYCDGDTVRKHRLFHDYYCDGGTCTDHTSLVDDQLVENCNDRDGWVDTGNKKWVPDPGNDCQEKERKEQEYRDYYCSGGACTYNVTGTQWVDTGTTRNKPDGTICGCTASNTLKRCYSGVCTDTGICDATTCGADAACDGKEPGDSCGSGTCDSNCKCGAVGEDYGVFNAPLWFVDKNCDQLADDVFGYGFAGATPLVGDFNQDGSDDIAVVDLPWWFVDTNGDQIADETFSYGFAGGTPLVGDFNQDGKDDIAVVSLPTWFVDTDMNQVADDVFGYGFAGATPMVGDFNQDGSDDIAVVDLPWWFVDTNGDQIADETFSYGFAGGTPLVGDFNQDGSDDIAVVSLPTWFVDTDRDQVADDTFGYGFAGATPIVGNFG